MVRSGKVEICYNFEMIEMKMRKLLYLVLGASCLLTACISCQVDHGTILKGGYQCRCRLTVLTGEQVRIGILPRPVQVGDRDKQAKKGDGSSGYSSFPCRASEWRSRSARKQTFFIQTLVQRIPGPVCFSFISFCFNHISCKSLIRLVVFGVLSSFRPRLF